MLQGEVVTNFLALYSLPEDVIARLKAWKFGADPSLETEELHILKQLPKAELHCHLGVIATAEELIRIALAAVPDIHGYQRFLKSSIEKWKTLIKTNDPELIMTGISSLKQVRKMVPDVPEALCTASFILLFKDSPDLLHRVMFGPFVDKEKFCRVEFNPYERIGDLQGSGLLSNMRCLEAACRVLAQKAEEKIVKLLHEIL